jgi:rhodanese-related sulfurtransferase
MLNVIAWLMGLKTISPAVLYQRLQTGQVSVFDVNSRGSWIKAHVPGAKNLDPTDFNATDLPQDQNSELVFYCSNPCVGRHRMRPDGLNRWGTRTPW